MKKKTLRYSKLHKYPYIKGNLMEVSVEGIRSKKTKKLLAQAAEFYGGLLLNKRTANIVNLTINLKRKLDGDAEGYCQYMSQSVGVREFDIEIEKDRPIDELLVTLAHEMVHLKQYATRQLKSKFVKGVPIDTWKGTKYRNIKYKEQPWEKEAMLLEESLYQQFMFFGLMHGLLDFEKIKQIDLS